MNGFNHRMSVRWKNRNPLIKGLLIAFWVLVGVTFAAGIALLVSYVVMLLWNHVLVKAVSGVHTVNYLQAVGLVILAKILFGSFGHGSDHRHNHVFPPVGPWARDRRGRSEEDDTDNKAFEVTHTQGDN